MDWRSLPSHPVHLILHHSVRTFALGATVESSPGLLIAFVLAVAVVSSGEVTIISILMASVFNVDLKKSKAWTTIRMTDNRFVLVDQGHFLFEVDWQQETLSWRISYPLTISILSLERFPFERSIPCNCLSELSSAHCKCMRLVIAGFVKFRSRKLMLWCAEQELKLLGIIEGFFNEFDFFYRNYFWL